MQHGMILLLTACCLLFATAAGFAQQVGVATAVNQSAQGTPPRQAIRTLTLGDNIIYDERIQTDSKGLLQILLADGTTFTVGPESELKIDSFVYDPDAGTASITATLGKGLFRFIGGTTSKTPDGVNLDTPVGTVGIRGAIVDMMFDPGNGMPSHIDLRYGEGLTLWRPGGAPARLYKAGYSIVIDNSNTIHIRRTPPQWTKFFQVLISGTGGEGGGASFKPTDSMVVVSRLSTTNSDSPMLLNSVPIPRARPPIHVPSVIDEAGRDVTRREAKELTDGGGDEPPPPTTEVPLRVLTLQSGAAGDGIVGGSADSDQDTVLVVEEGANEGTVDLVQGTVTLPYFDDTHFTAHSIGPLSSPFGALYGTAYGGPDGFTAYLLGVNGDPAEPFYAITGAPTDMAATFQGGGIRHYNLTPDPIQGIAVPFMTNDPGFDFSMATVSDFLVAEPDSFGDGSGRVLQTWLMIDGTGPAQKSAIGVNVGALADGGSDFSLDRRGSYRVSSSEGSYQLYGTAAALAVSDGNGIFGSNGENFVVSDNLDEAGHFHDSAADAFVAGEDFSTIHVGNLEDDAAGPNRSLAGPYEGFAAGLVEGTYDAGSGDTGDGWFLAESSGPEDVAFAFNPAAKSLGGSIKIFTQSGLVDSGAPEELTVAFGDGTNDSTQNGASAYIDDDTFAATANPDSTKTYVRQQNLSANSYQRGGQDAGTYVVSADSQDLTKIGADAANLCNSCDFLEWGWWGTQVQTTAPGDPSVEAGRFSVHMGTWIAGDISDTSEINNLELAGATATFEGLAVGNALSNGASYVAAGDMTLEYSFGARSGELSIDNFDGRGFSGTVGGNADRSETFQGALSGPSVSGSASGAFVNNGNDVGAGVIGNFNAQELEGDWQANGIFAGERTSLSTPPPVD